MPPFCKIVYEKMFLDSDDIVVMILSQREGYHAAHADYLRRGIYEQASALETVRCVTVRSAFRFY